MLEPLTKGIINVTYSGRYAVYLDSKHRGLWLHSMILYGSCQVEDRADNVGSYIPRAAGPRLVYWGARLRP